MATPGYYPIFSSFQNFADWWEIFFSHCWEFSKGRNSSYNNFLSLSGFEMYGDLYEDKDRGGGKDGYVSP